MSTPGPEALARLIQEARQAAGLSIRAAAKAAGFSPSRWEQIEKAHPNKPRAQTLAAMLVALQVETADALPYFEAAGLPTDHYARRMREAQLRAGYAQNAPTRGEVLRRARDDREDDEDAPAPPLPVGLGLDADAEGLAEEDVAPIRAALRELRRQRGLE